MQHAGVATPLRHAHTSATAPRGLRRWTPRLLLVVLGPCSRPARAGAWMLLGSGAFGPCVCVRPMHVRLFRLLIVVEFCVSLCEPDSRPLGVAARQLAARWSTLAR